MSEDVEQRAGNAVNQEGYYLPRIRMKLGTIDIHAIQNIPLERPSWICDQCHKEYRSFEVKQPLKLHGSDEIITVKTNSYGVSLMSEDVGQEPVVINADTLRIILGINAAIQGRDAKLMLNGKQVLAVALDGTCAFDTKEVDEIMLTNDQLTDLGEQALEHCLKREADDS